MHLAMTAQYPVKGRFACQISPFICQSRDYLRRRQACILRLMARLPYLLFFLRAEAVRGYRSYGCRTTVFRTFLPPPPGPQTQIDLPAGDSTPGSGGDRFINPQDELLAFILRSQSSPSVSP